MMNNVVLILSIAMMVYLCRLSGFVVQLSPDSTRWQRFLRFVPVSIFSTLIVPSFRSEPNLLTAKLAAFAVAGVILWKTRRFGLSIFLGLTAFFITTNI